MPTVMVGNVSLTRVRYSSGSRPILRLEYDLKEADPAPGLKEPDDRPDDSLPSAHILDASQPAHGVYRAVKEPWRTLSPLSFPLCLPALQ